LKAAPIRARFAVPLEDHPLIVKLSTFMKLSAQDLKSLEQILEAEKSIKKGKDLVVDGKEYRNLCFVKEEAYPVDSGSPTCSVMNGCNRAATRARFDGRCSFACPIPEGLC
jgi:hypothetical protein